MTRAEFSRGVALIQALIGEPIPKNTLDLWFELFRDWSAEEWLLTCRYLVDHFRPTAATKWPVPAQFREARTSVRIGDRNFELEAEEAWQRVLDALRPSSTEVVRTSRGWMPSGRKLTALDWAAIGGEIGLWNAYECLNEPGTIERIRDSFVDRYRRFARAVAVGEVSVEALPHQPGRVLPERREPRRIGQVLGLLESESSSK